MRKIESLFFFNIVEFDRIKKKNNDKDFTDSQSKQFSLTVFWSTVVLMIAKNKQTENSCIQ